MVTVREESLAGVMAEVYGRLTRRPGVMIGQGPWVLGNGLIGTLEALSVQFADAAADRFQRRAALHAARALSAGDRRLRQLGRAPRVRRRHEAGDAGAGADRRGAGDAARDQARDGRASRVRSPCCSATTRWPASVAPELAAGAVPDPLLSAAGRRRRPTRRRSRPPPSASSPPSAGASSPATGCASRRPTSSCASLPRRRGCRSRRPPPARAALPRRIRWRLGVFGTFGTPAANACVGEADLVLVVGSKLQPERHRLGEHASCSTRRGRSLSRSTSSRAMPRGISRPRPSCSSATRRRSSASSASAVRSRADGRREAAERRVAAAPRGARLFQRTGPISRTTSRSCRSGSSAS